MKLLILSAAALAVTGLGSTSLATDYAEWAAKGYRWSKVHGAHAYIKKEDAKSDRPGSKPVSETIGRAYYLRPGKVVLVVETDAAAGLSKIRLGGISADLWSPTRYLSTSPIRNTLGQIETPESSSILPISTATPSPASNTSSAPSASPSQKATPRK